MYSVHDIMEMMVPWFEGGTYIIDRSSHQSKGQAQSHYVDALCASYLGGLLEDLNLVPFQSEGDGNCLLHAVCKAVSGKDASFAALREQMTQELIENEPWYRFHLNLDDWEHSLEMARGDGNYLGFEHIFALANVLRRPIILVDNQDQVQAFGEGDGGVAATFLPTRVPIGPVIAPPLTIAWSSEDHRHYVPIVPALMAHDRYPRIPLPRVAFPQTLPPGVMPGDYFHYRVAAQSAQGTMQVKMRDRLQEAVTQLQSGDDPFQNALIIVRKFGMGRERIVPLTNFLLDLAAAHTVPIQLADVSWRILKDLNQIGPFPAKRTQDGPVSDLGKLKTKALEILQGIQPALPPEQLEQLKTLLDYSRSSSATPSSSTNGNTSPTATPEIPDAPFGLFIDVLCNNPHPVLVGTLHCFLSLPLELITPLVTKYHVPGRLVELVKNDGSMGIPLLVSLLRCFTCLLHPDYAHVSYPLIFHNDLMAITLKVIEEIPILHFSTLSPFVFNYALFVSHSQLFAPAVRDEHFAALAAFLARASREYQAHSEQKQTLFSAVENLLLAAGNLVLAQPALAGRAKHSILNQVPFLAQLGIAPALIADLTKLCDRPLPVSKLSRVPNLLTE